MQVSGCLPTLVYPSEVVGCVPPIISWKRGVPSPPLNATCLLKRRARSYRGAVRVVDPRKRWKFPRKSGGSASAKSAENPERVDCNIFDLTAVRTRKMLLARADMKVADTAKVRGSTYRNRPEALLEKRI